MSIIARLRNVSRIPSTRFDVSVFVVDVDGVLTDGSFTYSSEGKVTKQFGPDDADALKVLRTFVDVHIVSADHRGFEISRLRVEDMGFRLNLVPANERLEWIEGRWRLEHVAYMGDSFVDAPILRAVGLGLCPRDAHPVARRSANIITRHRGGRRAVAEACGILLQGRRIKSIPTLY